MKNMQTIAVYSESRIKTYGFQEMTDLSLLELTLGPGHEALRDLHIGDLKVSGIHFHLGFAQMAKDQCLRLYLLIDHPFETEALNRIRNRDPVHGRNAVRASSPVELLHFQGPHYGDRYGIAETTLEALKKEGIPLLAVACSQSCVYLVLPPEGAQQAKRCLSQVFEIPRRRPRRRPQR